MAVKENLLVNLMFYRKSCINNENEVFDKVNTTTILDKTVETLALVSTNVRTTDRFFNPLPPFQCCQCCRVVQTKSGEPQTP